MSALVPVPRVRAADAVFEQLAAAIVQGELEAGVALPPERLLAERFAVSRLIVREALHRLADMQLVSVRQGGKSMVLDPHQASDIRLIGLYYRLDLAPEQSARVTRDIIEKQFMQGLSLIEVAHRRASSAERRALVELCQQFDETRESDAAFVAFEERFWRAVATAGKNQILLREVRWFYELLAKRPVSPNASVPLAARIGFYRELSRRLCARTAPGAYYLEVVTPMLDQLLGAAETQREAVT